MDDFIAARSQMALSLGFHIIFSCIGMAMPFFMAVSEWLWLKKGDPVYLQITKAWSRGVAIFFATGAVSGTVLSFELGLLWPEFMRHAGPIFGMPFSLEGTAFFIEAIALGFFIYGWGRFNKWFHWFSGVVVGVSGLTSGILVVSANSWMNSPSGFKFVKGKYTDIDPITAMFNDAWFSQALHMSLAAFAATAFAVSGIHALMILKKKNVEFHSKAFNIVIIFGIISSLLQPLSGDLSAKGVAKRQPAKLAAMEAHFKTSSHVPIFVGGIPDPKNKTVDYNITLPNMLSIMIGGNSDTVVKGLDSFPPSQIPPVAIVHYGFQLMVAMGIIMLALSGLLLLTMVFRKKWRSSSWLLTLYAFATPVGFIAVEAGWVVTEVGRQPWIIQGVMKTSDAVTAVPGVIYSFYTFTIIYLSLACMVFYMLYRQIKKLNEDGNTIIELNQ